MSDTYEFLKAQKDAIVAKQDAELAEWLTAASEDIAHYRKQLAEAKAKIESLQAAQTEAVKQTEGLADTRRTGTGAEVARLTALGWSAQEIADKLTVSRWTVYIHRRKQNNV